MELIVFCNFRFEERFFTLGQKPPLICGSCQKDGHCKADCREDELPPLKRLPPINTHFLNVLTAIFEQLTSKALILYMCVCIYLVVQGLGNMLVWFCVHVYICPTLCVCVCVV